MARSTSALEDAVHATDEYTVFTKVEIKDHSGTWIDYTNIEGRNWFEEADINANIDEHVMTADVTLRLFEDDLNLAALDTNSKFNSSFAQVDVGRKIRIWTMTVPLGETVDTQGGTWQNVFYGEIDEADPQVDQSGSKLKLSCRDDGCRAQDHWIEAEGHPDGSGGYVPYADSVDTNVEDVIQEILDDWVGTPGGFTLNVPVSPGWALYSRTHGDQYGYRPGKKSVMDAINELAGMIGWKVRLKSTGGPGGSTWELTLYEPDRSKSSADWTLSPSQIIKAKRFSRSRLGVRNRIIVSYLTDPADETSRVRSVYEDATSQANYGVRYMEMDEAKNSAINTSTEADKLGGAALLDLKDVLADGELEMPYRFYVELEDLAQLTGPTKLYSSSQLAAVVAFQHKLTPSTCRTSIQVRQNRPAGFFGWWWTHQSKLNGIGQRIVPDPQPTHAAAAIIGGAILSIPTNPPLNPQTHSHTEWHISTSSGFTPGPSTLKATSLTPKMTIGGLTPGTTYYSKVVTVRKDGAKSAASAEVSFVAARATGADIDTALTLEGTLNVPNPVVMAPAPSDGMPYAFVWDCASTNLIHNPSFEVNVTDGWTAESGITFARDTTTFKFGTACGKITHDGSSSLLGIYSNEIDNSSGHIYSFAVWISGGAGVDVLCTIEGWNGSSWVDVGESKVIILSGGWDRISEQGVAASATYTKIRCCIRTDYASAVLYVDGAICESWGELNRRESSYFDGDSGPGCAWTGTAHNSTSTRAAGAHTLGAMNAAGAYGPVIIRDDGTVDFGNEAHFGGDSMLNFGIDVDRNFAGVFGNINLRANTVQNNSDSSIRIIPAQFGAVELGYGANRMLIRGAGTSFPSNPVTNQLWFRTDLGMMCYYDGTYWLSEQIFTVAMPAYNNINPTTNASNAKMCAIPYHPQGYGKDIYPLWWDCACYFGTAQSSANHYRGHWNWMGTDKDIFDTTAYTPGGWRFIHRALTGAAPLTTPTPSDTTSVQGYVEAYLSVQAGSPGQLYFECSWAYRLILT